MNSCGCHNIDVQLHEEESLVLIKQQSIFLKKDKSELKRTCNQESEEKISCWTRRRDRVMGQSASKRHRTSRKRQSEEEYGIQARPDTTCVIETDTSRVWYGTRAKLRDLMPWGALVSRAWRQGAMNETETPMSRQTSTGHLHKMETPMINRNLLIKPMTLSS